MPTDIGLPGKPVYPNLILGRYVLSDLKRFVVSERKYNFILHEASLKTNITCKYPPPPSIHSTENLLEPQIQSS